MKRILFTVVLVGLSTILYSQPYKSSIGLRAGIAPGITFKTFVKPGAAFEALLNTRFSGIQFTGLYEWHSPLGEVPNFYWYIGVGGHVGIFNNNRYINDPLIDNYVGVGIDGILGMEYTFEEIPLNLSLDWKPYLNFFEYYYFLGDGLGLSARYVISGHQSRRRR